MQIVKVNKTIVIERKNAFDQPKLIETVNFFDRFNVELYNKIKKVKNEFAPVSTRIEK